MNTTNCQDKYAEVKQTPSRFRHTIGKYKVYRGPQCKDCATCAVSCPHGVHFKAGTRMALPRGYLCVGPAAGQGSSHYCVDKCPNKALKVAEKPQVRALGDYRWTAELLMSTW